MRRPAGEDGSISVLVLGLFGVLLLLVAVVTDVSAAVLARRALASAADGAALAAAQEVDEDRLVREGFGARLPLDAAAVRSAVARHARGLESLQPGLRLRAEVGPGATTATVVATRTIRLPFLGPLAGTRLTLTARSAVQTAPDG